LCLFHERKDNNQVFYVGSGTLDRIRHTTTRSNLWKSIKEASGGVVYEILHKNISKELSLELEKEYIDLYRASLVNCAHYKPDVKELNFEDFNDRFYIDETSPTFYVIKLM